MMIENISELIIQRMKDAVAYSTKHVHDGGIPFTAFVVNEHGTVLGRGVNRVRENHDPTAHAEVEAIRNACRGQRTPHLHGMTLLATGEPCAMCYLSALYAGIEHILFAVDRNEAAEHGFDYRGTYSLFSRDPLSWEPFSARKLQVSESIQPFTTFHARLSGHQRMNS